MGRIIDLSMPMDKDHFRWPIERRLARSFENGDTSQVTWAGWSVHSFTHMDSARHFEPSGWTTSQVDLNQVVGDAAIVDLTHIGPNDEIGGSELEAVGADIRQGDIALLRTGWDQRESVRSETYWTNSPYISESGATWLRDRGIKAIGFDFPQDYCIRYYVTGEREPAREENTTHMILLLNGVIMFEYLCNLTAITQPRVTFVGLPLKLPDADGAPARVVVIEP